VHTSWPIGKGSSDRRNRQLERLAALSSATATPLVVVGDLNISPFSPHFRQLLADGKLKSAADGFGWQPTWPSFLLPAGIQIDHGLVNGAVSVQGFHRGGRDGSDHLPIVLDVVL
jgi:endonuclease/exonuclease/phosphatase family metal-dependent hydrolase